MERRRRGMSAALGADVTAPRRSVKPQRVSAGDGRRDGSAARRTGPRTERGTTGEPGLETWCPGPFLPVGERAAKPLQRTPPGRK